ncbi:MAG TPA: hypothetical protein DD490_21800 [Acidobacteria bacterium]|nr:hypothetical protein [Acidobacteriota bacterium]
MSTAPESWTPPAETAPPPAAPPAPVRTLPPALAVKKPALAAFLSLFPGLGNVYNGLYLRGAIFFLIYATLLGIIITSNGDTAFFFGPLMAFFFFFGMIDAYRQAILINHGYQQDLGILDLPKRPRAGQGGIAAGVILVLIGIYALLEQYVDIRLDWLFDLWPVVAIALGGWLIWGTLRDRKKAES